MDTAVFPDQAEYAFELVGVFTFALSGAMVAVRRDFDIVGIVVLAGLTALGGGVIRDVLIGATPPYVFSHVDLLLVPLAATLVVVFAHPVIERRGKAILWFDAAGLAVFTINGTLIAEAAGLEVLPAALLGIVTGVGGGLLRDVVAREVPLLVRKDSEIYAIPAAAGAVVVAVLAAEDVYEHWMGIGAVVLVFAIRIAAVTFGWNAPGAFRRHPTPST
ncbi:hypothetical protein B7486_54900 [cyanobacterium TDX16]|nr:hypothetical protein B7486_54900 [cyanobacterium TDX16]